MNDIKVKLKDNSGWLPNVKKENYYEKQQLLFVPTNELINMISNLQTRWDSLREWLEDNDKENMIIGWNEVVYVDDVLDKINELEDGIK